MHTKREDGANSSSYRSSCLNKLVLHQPLLGIIRITAVLSTLLFGLGERTQDVITDWLRLTLAILDTCVTLRLSVRSAVDLVFEDDGKGKENHGLWQAVLAFIP